MRPKGCRDQGGIGARKRSGKVVFGATSPNQRCSGKLPSTPPSTDEIDTDWGADEASEVTRVMQQPMLAQMRPAPAPSGSVEPSKPTPLVPLELTRFQAASLIARLGAAARARRAGARSRSDGIGAAARREAAGTFRERAAPDASALPNVDRPASTNGSSNARARIHAAASEARIHAAADAERCILRNSPHVVRAPASSSKPSSAPPPVVEPSVPPSPIATRSSAPTAQVPSSSPPAHGSLPAPLPSNTVPKPSAANPSGFVRWLLVLAAGLVVVSVLGYRVLLRNNAPLIVATEPLEPAATVTPTANRRHRVRLGRFRAQRRSGRCRSPVPLPLPTPLLLPIPLSNRRSHFPCRSHGPRRLPILLLRSPRL